MCYAVGEVMAEIIASVGAAIGAALLGLAVRCLYQRIQEAGNCRCSCSSDEKDGCGCSCLTGKPKEQPQQAVAGAVAAPPAAQDMTAGSNHLTPPFPLSRYTKRGRQRRQSPSTSSIDLDKIVQRQILHSMVRSSQAAQAAQAMLRIREEEEEDDKEEKNPEPSKATIEAPCNLTPSGASTGSGGSTASVGPDTEVPRIPLREVVRQIVEQQRRRHSKSKPATTTSTTAS